MKPVTMRVSRPRNPLHGWTNCILRIDLSRMTAHTQESASYLPAFLGGRGLGARLAWEDHPGPVDPFDPASPLMIIPGALTGSRSPYSGRTSVCAFSPQAFPYPWFTRSNVGRHFGGELKRAGYDALVITGAAQSPVRIQIRDDEVSILPADDLWGQDALDTIDALSTQVGRGVRSMVILQVWGRGLWSTMYGYLALDNDGNTIRGLTFYEHGETPGLGGEVDNPRWKAAWPGRRVFDTNNRPSLVMRKGGAGAPNQDPHGFDGLSGATITSRGVEHLLNFWLGEAGYGPFLAQLKANP